VVDAVALMGGNEYLIQQMIDRLIDTGFRYFI
jgi:predicted aspartyl protease